MPETVKILGIAGSLRRGSYNRALLRAARQLLPSGTTMDILELHGIPVFNEDDEKNPPETVLEMKRRVRAADALLFATPEYNYSVPGGLKNAIDWGSRPYGDSAWLGKPAAIMGASVGRMGTARSQYHLRQVFVYLQVEAVLQPEVMVGNASEYFDQDLNLTHETSRRLIRELMEALVAKTHQIRTCR